MSAETRKILDKYVDTKKCVEYLKKQQNPDGSYPGLKPCPMATMHCLKILKLLGRKPQYENTIKWVQSLQTGKRGFGETTGQNSWDYTTYYGSEMHKALGIRPRYDKEIKEFILSHKNEDGGFSSNYEPKSTLQPTRYWSLAALNLGFEIGQKTCEYLNEQLRYYENLSLSNVYDIMKILRNNKVRINNESNIKKHIKELKESRIFYIYYSSKILGIRDQVSHEKFIAGFDKVFHNTQISLMILELYIQFGISFDEQEFIRYVNNLELPEGGFYNKNQTNLLTAYECIESLIMLDDKPSINATDWIRTLQTSDGGFSGSEGSASWINMQFRTLRMLKAYDSKIDTADLKRYLEQTIFPINTFNAFYGTYAYAELNEVPFRYRKIIQDTLKFQADGGFSGNIGGKADMYATERCVCAISNIMRLLDIKKKPHLNWLLKIQKKVVKWVYQCENKGGFGWIPGETSYVQPTFLALHTLWVHKAKPRHVKEHLDYVTNCIKKNGGFHGGEKGTPSGPLYMYYALASILILDSFKKQKTDIDDYLGL